MRTRLLPTVVLLLLTAATVVSCARSVPGRAVQIGVGPVGPPPAYAKALDAEDQQTLAYHAMIRSIDQCGFLDRHALESLGVVREFSASLQVSGCEARVDVDRDSSRQLDITVRTIARGVKYAGKDTTPVTLAGVEVGEAVQYEPSTAPSGNACWITAPFDERTSVFLSVYRRTPQAPCVEARGLVAAMIALPVRPLRVDSQREAMHAVSVADPCEALGTLAREHRVELAEDSLPWSCRFRLDGGKDVHGIAFDWTTQGSYDTPGAGDRVTVDGRKALEKDLGGLCTVEVWIPDPLDGVDYDPIGGAGVTNTLRTTAPTCERASATAVVALREYLN